MSSGRWIAEFSTPSEHWTADGSTQREAAVALHRKWDEHQGVLEQEHGHVPVFVRQYHALVGKTFDEYWHVAYHKVHEPEDAGAGHPRRLIKAQPVTIHRMRPAAKG